ncbi:DUF6527 family protein [Puniceicoccus vermicola]|uniref:DUF6527 family protein n=1 Tax=Puniceicoccus vermicola TaxID=388746 RepID=UPI0031B65076
MIQQFIRRLISPFLSRFSKKWRLVIVEGDSLPDKIPQRVLVLARDGHEDWCVGMRCPCGCQKLIELMLIPEASPRWTLMTDSKGRPTLKPSVWLKAGCRSHFWLRNGQVEWCRDSDQA